MNVFYYTQLTDLMKIKFEKKSNVIYTIWLYIVLFYGTSKTFVDTFSDFSILVKAS